MILTTTPTIEGYPVKQYLGVVASETIIGANVFRDIMAGLRDFFGGRSSSYEEVLKKAKDTALQELQERAAALGANAVIGIDLDYETVGSNGSMLMVTAQRFEAAFARSALPLARRDSARCRCVGSRDGFGVRNR